MDSGRVMRRGRYQAEMSFCRVCFEQARYSHYGAITCSSCKTFFYRRASQTTVRIIGSVSASRVLSYVLEFRTLFFGQQLRDQLEVEKSLYGLPLCEMPGSRHESRSDSKGEFVCGHSHSIDDRSRSPEFPSSFTTTASGSSVQRSFDARNIRMATAVQRGARLRQVHARRRDSKNH